ncbi:VOC family protein [Candidatus Cetobacterium colombiensis]|uniref:VOC family protein n=1 Tax=Candidatus Cetobacterium colombiensis TaxID=3073100 RepID=A0ABU4WDT7_9FUSO|nr:VOC family protein [Candidatus Cetobacterium colombiensis]MDX8337369.1 VOC family protein [Candidatus Cetobacterium colombiensis]
MKIHHVCIETTTYEESIFFYTKVLNFSLQKETPNFHGRNYNSWLELDGFYIELQTPKMEQLKQIEQNTIGLIHMCFYVEDIVKELERIKLLYSNFKLKNNEILYRVENGNLFKLIAPEGTIIEIRDNLSF